ncbi:GTP-binding protein [Anaerocolumna chitinilytica]|uniref:Cobalamin synthesis protein CobW n=1 Tax=Anaerocolumna chitinilytica TaxID=1727145 RepID=A0A7I8DU64_9FIRM|nr:GTP-binding protein [Anaerocolumna chitinilytica]BCJ99826.1 cobalamin synthesis protein CobW [Anaerocolumna chitinilytica]
MNKRIPITLITGYLGSGKTTLLNQVLKNQKGYKVAVIVNDIGEINIDAELIERGGEVTLAEDNLVALSNGCICCSLKTDLMKQIVQLVKQRRFDYIVIEASGICEPLSIVQTIAMLDGTVEDERLPNICRLDNVVTVVDARRLVDEFLGGRSLIKENIEEDDIESLVIQQIEFCNTIILNKVSDVTEAEKREILSIIRQLQPEAEIIETDYARVEVTKVLNTEKFSLDKVESSSGWKKAFLEEKDHSHEHESQQEEHTHQHRHHHHHHNGETDEYGISTFLYYTRRPFIYEKFEEWINSKWPANIIRSKGMVWFSDEWDNAHIFEQAGKQVNLTPAGLWAAAATKEELEAAMKKYPTIKENWDKTYGDRMIKLVFIGKNMDKVKICKELDACLDN